MIKKFNKKKNKFNIKKVTVFRITFKKIKDTINQRTNHLKKLKANKAI